MKKNNLTIKTFFYLSIFVSIILIFLWLFQIQFLQVSYENYIVNNIKNVAKDIKNKSDDIEDVLEDYAYKNDICIEYRTSDTIYEYNTKKVGCLLKMNNYEISKYKSKLINSNLDYIKLSAPNTKIKSIIYAIDLGNNKYVFLNTNLEDLNSATAFLKQQLIYIVLLLILISVILSIFISKKINKPILKIISSAKELGKGNYDVKFERCNIAELNELGDVLTVAASEMNKTEQLKRDLIANVSHDLKTPLTMIKAYAEKVRDLSYKDNEIRNKDLNIIISETDRLNTLVNDLLDMSKIESGHIDLEIEEYDIVSEINEILKRYDLQREKYGYNFVVDMPKKAVVKADKSKINQVIYNLINNALDHTGDDLLVKILVKKQKGGYLVSIENSGKGLSDEEKVLVWNRYYKTDKKHKRNTVGSGIGLSIVKEILEFHKFEYGIDSKLNEYTKFYFIMK